MPRTMLHHLQPHRSLTSPRQSWKLTVVRGLICSYTPIIYITVISARGRRRRLGCMVQQELELLTDEGGWGQLGLVGLSVGSATLVTAKDPGVSPSGCKAALWELLVGVSAKQSAPTGQVGVRGGPLMSEIDGGPAKALHTRMVQRGSKALWT